MDDVGRLRDSRSYDLGITTAFLFGVSSAKCISL